ncbi:hypothetical protein [Vibrio scophthalmi]|uniref:Uncharacterized protein n=1 Tax=Vibrio scophthalmi LMG 19158 TaxID=870967 RepID=F9RQ06_9VIBR|nr:hypothetical protein [Vibrio scophthalmi]EGU34781.1 hypothetical protein VIS19158_03752 [Vibrio scophthalmi LMG 19158]
MSLTEGIIWLAGSRVKTSRTIGRSRVFECDYEPLLSHGRVKQFIGEVEPTLMQTSRGAIAVVRIGKDIIFWNRERIAQVPNERIP